MFSHASVNLLGGGRASLVPCSFRGGGGGGRYLGGGYRAGFRGGMSETTKAGATHCCLIVAGICKRRQSINVFSHNRSGNLFIFVTFSQLSVSRKGWSLRTTLDYRPVRRVLPDRTRSTRRSASRAPPEPAPEVWAETPSTTAEVNTLAPTYNASDVCLYRSTRSHLH